jgi:hypothetical protein
MRTVTAPPGPRVVGQGRQRDGGRSPHRAPAYRWGQTWGGLAGLVQWPCATRPWALPVSVALVPPSSVGACARHAASPPSTSRPAAAGAPATRGSGASRHFCGGHRGRHERDRAVLPSIPPSPPPGAHVLGRGRPVGAAAPAPAPHGHVGWRKPQRQRARHRHRALRPPRGGVWLHDRAAQGPETAPGV